MAFECVLGLGPPYPCPVPRETRNLVPHSHNDLAPDLKELIDLVVRTIARRKIPVMVLLPSDNFAAACIAFNRLSEAALWD